MRNTFHGGAWSPWTQPRPVRRGGIPANDAYPEAAVPGSGSDDPLTTIHSVEGRANRENRLLRVIDLCERSDDLSNLRRLIVKEQYGTVGCPPEPPRDLVPPPTPVMTAIEAMEKACAAHGASLEGVGFSRRRQYVIAIDCHAVLDDTRPGMTWYSTANLHVCDVHEDMTHHKETLSGLPGFSVDCSRRDSRVGMKERERQRECLKKNLNAPQRCGVSEEVKDLG
jgi:hypothetical protein